MSLPLYVVLLHHPVTNRKGEVVTTSVTNMDVHDISRTARTYGAKGYFLVTPVKEQHDIVKRVLGYWNAGAMNEYHPDRATAVGLAQLAFDFDEVKQKIRELENMPVGESPLVVMTSARAHHNAVTYAEFRNELAELWKTSKRPVVIVFGNWMGNRRNFLSRGAPDSDASVRARKRAGLQSSLGSISCSHCAGPAVRRVTRVLF